MARKTPTSQEIADLEAELMEGKEVTIQDIAHFCRLQNFFINQSLSYCREIDENPSHLNSYYPKIVLCEMATGPLKYGLINYTKNETFFAQERFPEKDLDISVLHYLTGQSFFKGFNNKYYKSPIQGVLNQSCNSHADALEILASCTENGMPYKDIENSMMLIASKHDLSSLYKFSVNHLIFAQDNHA